MLEAPPSPSTDDAPDADLAVTSMGEVFGTNEATTRMDGCGAQIAGHVIAMWNWTKKFNAFALVVTAIAPPAGALPLAVEEAVLATAVVAVVPYTVYDCVSNNGGLSPINTNN